MGSVVGLSLRFSDCPRPRANPVTPNGGVSQNSEMGGSMQGGVISQTSVERIGSGLVANELEFRGFRITDLNKDGLSPNAAAGVDCPRCRYQYTSRLYIDENRFRF